MTQSDLVKKQNQVILGDEAPNFRVATTKGEIDFHEYLGDSWGLLFSHPKDNTPVCTTELGRAAQLEEEFAKRDVKPIGAPVNFPMIADNERKVALLYGMLDQSGLEAHTPFTVRSVFIIGPDKKIKLIITYPASTGRNFTEILRVIDSLQLTATKQCATPSDWKKGDDVVILPSLSDSEAKQRFGKFRTIKPYLRMTQDPSGK